MQAWWQERPVTTPSPTRRCAARANSFCRWVWLFLWRAQHPLSLFIWIIEIAIRDEKLATLFADLASLDNHYIKMCCLNTNQIYFWPYKATKEPVYPLFAQISSFALCQKICFLVYISSLNTKWLKVSYLWLRKSLLLTTMHHGHMTGNTIYSFTSVLLRPSVTTNCYDRRS